MGLLALAVPAAAAAAGFLAASLWGGARQRQHQRRQRSAAAARSDWRAEGDLHFAEGTKGTSLNLASLTAADPPAFYLQPGTRRLPDCSATVGGVLLSLDSKPLASESAILRDIFEAWEAGKLASGSAGVDLSPMFDGSTWQETACLLRLAYHPASEAAPANLAVLAAAGHLPAVARLAHFLDMPRLLRAIDAYLQAAMKRARAVELVMAARVSQACNSPLREAALNGLAEKLATAGRCASLLKQQQALATLHSSTLAQLLRRTLRCLDVDAAERKQAAAAARMAVADLERRRKLQSERMSRCFQQFFV